MNGLGEGLFIVMELLIVAAFCVAVVMLFFFGAKKKVSDRLDELEKEHSMHMKKKRRSWKEEANAFRPAKVIYIKKEEPKNKKEEEMMEAARMITEERRNGANIEECIVLLHNTKHSEEEIERILEQSDRIM
ncbi:MAG: hypothetical protein ABIE23_00200 [archaeon]